MAFEKTTHNIKPTVKPDKAQGIQQEKAQLSSTTYLDGLKGVISCIVFIRHYYLPWQENLNEGFGHGKNRSLFQLPILRVIYSGPTAAMFFVISGYVCSYKPIRLIRNQSYNALLFTVSSAIFRRAIRLFLPPIITTLAVMICVRLDIYKFDYEIMPGVVTYPPKYYPTLYLQIMDWLKFLMNDLMNIWTWGVRSFDYDIHLYTIPIQFRTSMIIFVVVIGLARIRTPARVLILACLFGYCMWMGRWEVALYFGGTLLTEYNLIQLEKASSSGPGDENSLSPTKKTLVLSKAFWFCLLLCGLYLGSFPRVLGTAERTPGFIWLSQLTPNPRYWQSYAAILIIWSLDNAKFLQMVFELSYAQYLGRISFSLYLVHGPVLHVFGYAAAPAMLKMTGHETTFQYQIGLLLGILALFPIVLLVADLFHRHVDIPCAKLAKWIESKLTQ